MASAPPALAGSAGEGLPNGGVHFTATPGEAPNRVTITPIPGGFRIRDAANNIGSGCAAPQPDPSTADCMGTRLEVTLDDGNDTIVLDAAAPGGAQVFGGEGTDTITGNAEVDMILGGSEDGSSPDGADTIDGRGGNDVIDGQQGADTLGGGDGNDTVRGGAADGGNDALAGGNGDDTLEGGPGDDSNQGGPGRDTVSAGGGNDTADGDDGDDTVSGGAGGDNLAGGAGNDSLRGFDTTGIGTDGDDLLAGGDGADAMAGGPGVDRSLYERVRAPVFVTLDDQPDDGQPGEGDNVASDVEDVTGGDDQNTLTGSVASNTLQGAGGEDYVDGAAATDTLITGASGDTVRSRDGERDVVQCGDGPDFAIADPQDSVSGECETNDTGNSRPRLGRRIVARPLATSAQGTILTALAMQLPKVNRFVPLVDKVGLPAGTVLDASTRGVALRFARRRRGARTATLSGGRFRMRQSRRTGVAQLALRGGDFSQCRNLRSKDAGVAQRRRIRRLRGRTRGRHRVRGRYSSGSTRGTGWLVEDRCDGTLTRVTSGRVVVRDFAKRRTIVLRRGQRYLARPRRR
jgi:hypothetical protein